MKKSITLTFNGVLLFFVMCLINTLPVFAEMANSDVSKYSITMDVNVESFESSRDYAKKMFEENSAVFNDVKDWVLSEKCQPFYKTGPYPEEVCKSVFWTESRRRWDEKADLYKSESVYENFDLLFSKFNICTVTALNEKREVNLYSNPAVIVSFGILDEQYECEDVSAPPPVGYEEKSVIISYDGKETFEANGYENDYIETIGDGWHLIMSGYDNIDFPKPITTTAPPSIPTETTTTTVTTTEVKPNTEPSKSENERSEIVFVEAGFDECYVGNTDYPPESYKGYFVERNGNVRSFSFEDVNEHWTFGYVSMEDIPKTISLNQTTPQEKLLSHLTDVSKYQIVGKISEEELERNLNLLSDIETNVNIKMDISPLDIVQGYSETFGLRYDDNGNAEVVFLNGMGTIINKHTDENAHEIDSWLRNLDISSDNPKTETTQPNPTENTTTTTTVTTTEVKPNTESSKNENEQSEIVFCTVKSEQTGRTSYSYGGFFIENNGNVRHFYFEDIEDNWMLISGSDYFSDDGNIKLNEAMPHDKLLSRLNNNISEYKIVGNISTEEYASKASLLSEIKVDAEIPFVPVEIAGMTSYTESFGVRYDNDDNAQIMFMNGHVSGDMKYRTYLENPDEKSIELNNWLIEKCQSFISPELITTTVPTTPDTTTTTTVTTTITAETDTVQTTEPAAATEPTNTTRVTTSKVTVTTTKTTTTEPKVTTKLVTTIKPKTTTAPITITVAVHGDISGNGKVDIQDAIIVAKHLLGIRNLNDEEKDISDFNRDGKVDLYDAIGIAKYLLNKK